MDVEGYEEFLPIIGFPSRNQETLLNVDSVLSVLTV